jgi:WD40 repeat protein
MDLWDFASLQRAFRIERQDRMSAISFSNNGEWIVAGGTSPVELEVWALNETAGPRMTFPADSVLWAAAAASDGQRFYGISMNGTLSMWQAGQETPVRSVQGFFPFAIGTNARPLGFVPLAFSPDSQSLQYSVATSANPPAANLLEMSVQDGALQRITSDPRILPAFGDNPLVSLAVSPDGSRTAAIYFSLDYHAVRLFDTATGQQTGEIPFGYMLDYAAFTSDGRSLVVYGLQQPVVVVDAETGAVLGEIPVGEELGGGLFEMHLSRDGSRLVLIGYNGAIHVYNSATLELIAARGAPSDAEYPNTLAVSSDGSLIAIYQYDSAIRLWDVASDSLLPPFQDVPNDFFQPVNLALSPDSRMLAVARWDGTMRLFDVAP